MRGKKRALEPWLTGGGVALGDSELRDVSRGWDRATWQNYLKWFETASGENVIAADAYDRLCEQNAKTVFEKTAPSSDPDQTVFCERLLSKLPADESTALRMKFFEGAKGREIAEALGNRARSSAYNKQNRGLSRIRRGLQGDGLFTRPYIGGEREKNEFSSPWYDGETQPFLFNCDPANLKPQSAAVAFRYVSSLQREVLRLRFWENLPFSRIGAIAGIGATAARQVCDAAVFRLKSIAVSEETLQRNERTSR